MKKSWPAVFMVFVLGCQDFGGPQGLARSPLCTDSCGPTIIYDPTDRSDIRIPFPNDLLLTLDSSTPTGLRLNVSTQRDTWVESRLMQHLNELDGFSTFAPIVVQFDGPIDPSTANPSTVFVINIEPKSPGFGEKVPLDLGIGDYPVRMPKPYPLFAGDPFSNDMSLLIPDDNTWDLDGDGVEEFVNYYEQKSSTLIIRPRLPLRPGTRYAVILTKGVMGFGPDGRLHPIHSPLDWVNDPSQTPYLLEGRSALARWGIGSKDIAFAWTFTTGSITYQLDMIREGLYGKGPFAFLKDMARKGFVEVHDTGIAFDGDGSKKDMPYDPHDNIFILQAEFFNKLIKLIASFYPPAKYYKVDNIDYFVFGEVSSIDLRATKDHVWHIDPGKGVLRAREYKVPFLLTVPKATKKHKPPFPVVLYAHGNQTSRLELLLFSNYIARFGLAGLVIDEIGHGPLVDGIKGALKELGSTLNQTSERMVLDLIASLVLPGGAKDIKGMSNEEAEKRLESVGIIKELTKYGRSYDLNQDGIRTNGEGFFVPDPFEQRDIFRQMVVDYLVLARLVKSLDPKKVPPPYRGDPHSATLEDLKPYLQAGDFNADGVLDIGGAKNPLFMAGISLGGIMTTLVSSYEPDIVAATPFVAGGGVADILARSLLRERLKEGLYFAIGPVLTSCRKDQYIYFGFNDQLDYSVTDKGIVCKGDLSNAVYRVFDYSWDTLEARNTSNGRTALASFNEDGLVFVAIPSDRGDEWEVSLTNKSGRKVKFYVMAPVSGLAIPRDSHKFIVNFSLTQMILDPADPVVVASRIFWHPPQGWTARGILQEALVADTTVPVATQVTLARSAGLLGTTYATWDRWDRLLIQHGIVQGKDVDVDDADKSGDGFGPVPGIQSGKIISAVRFAFARGKHEYMAEPDPTKPFDMASYALNQAALYLASRGTLVLDDLCLSRSDCEIFEKY